MISPNTLTGKTIKKAPALTVLVTNLAQQPPP